MNQIKYSKDDEDFEPLPIAGGVGGYNVNQFRIHFKLPLPITFSGKGREEAIQFTVEDLFSKFPFYFNGDNSVMKENLARVEWGDKTYKKQKTLRFALKSSLAKGHGDWVSISWQNTTQLGSKGFAAQTLHRNFTELSEDAKVYTKAYAAATLLSGPIAANLAAMAAVSINRDHVLAGRRSWIVGWVNKYPGARTPASNSTLCYIETAAVERDSNVLVKPMEAMIAAREALVGIWCNLLYNYVLAKNHWIDSNSPLSFQSDDGDKLWRSYVHTPCHYRESAYASEALLKKDAWVRNLLVMHPALNEQLVGIEAAPVRRRAQAPLRPYR